MSPIGDVPRLAERPPLRRILLRAWPYFRADQRSIAVAVVCSALSTIALTMVPPTIGWATDELLARDRSGALLAAGTVVVLAVVRMFLFRNAEFRLAWAGERVVRRLRDRVVARVAAAPLRFVEAHRSGDLLRRMTSEIADLTKFVRNDLPTVLSVFGYLVFSTAVLVWYSWLLTLVLTVVFVPPAVLVMRSFKRASGVAFADKAAAQTAVAATYREGVQAQELLRTAGAAGTWLRRFGQDTDRLQSRSTDDHP